MNIYNYLIIVSQKDIPLHRDFNIYTKVLKKQNKAFKLKLSHPSAVHRGVLLPVTSFAPV